jgi:hypothetical protein
MTETAVTQLTEGQWLTLCSVIERCKKPLLVVEAHLLVFQKPLSDWLSPIESSYDIEEAGRKISTWLGQLKTKGLVEPDGKGIYFQYLYWKPTDLGYAFAGQANPDST